jgi:hypothetical protein
VRKLVVALAGVAVAAVVLGAGRGAAADDAGARPALTATMSCEHVDGPGRVRCEVEARVSPGDAIAWGDVVLLKTPDFVGALRGRIGPRDAVVHDPDLWRWALALVAKQKGTGEVLARVRLVLCHGEQCSPREVEVTGHVVAGD